MRFVRQARQAVRESSEMARLLTLSEDERSVVVYAEDSFSYVQLGGYLDALWRDHGISYHYVTSDPDDPLLTEAPPGATVWFIRDQLARFMSNLECGVFVTTMPDLGQFHVPRPRRGTTVYVFHSLNSTHTAYRSGAFEHYDHFLCTGPHHVKELTALRSHNPAVLHETGYHKLDLVRSQYADFQTHGSLSDGLVLLAPSWGEMNLLEAGGSEIIRSLLRAGLRVIVRPHPQFFHSLYPEGEQVVRGLTREFGREDNVEFELSIDTQDSFLKSQLMISDWSGAAYEFALGTGRLALFVDTPQKIFNDAWADLGLTSFEKAMREEVGVIVPLDEASSIGERSSRMLRRSRDVYRHLDDLSSRLIFNVGESASAGARTLAALL